MQAPSKKTVDGKRAQPISEDSETVESRKQDESGTSIPLLSLLPTDNAKLKDGHRSSVRRWTDPVVLVPDAERKPKENQWTDPNALLKGTFKDSHRLRIFLKHIYPICLNFWKDRGSDTPLLDELFFITDPVESERLFGFVKSVRSDFTDSQEAKFHIKVKLPDFGEHCETGTEEDEHYCAARMSVCTNVRRRSSMLARLLHFRSSIFGKKHVRGHEDGKQNLSEYTGRVRMQLTNENNPEEYAYIDFFRDGAMDHPIYTLPKDNKEQLKNLMDTAFAALKKKFGTGDVHK